MFCCDNKLRHNSSLSLSYNYPPPIDSTLSYVSKRQLSLMWIRQKTYRISYHELGRNSQETDNLKLNSDIWVLYYQPSWKLATVKASKATVAVYIINSVDKTWLFFYTPTAAAQVLSKLTPCLNIKFSFLVNLISDFSWINFHGNWTALVTQLLIDSTYTCCRLEERMITGWQKHQC